MPSSNGSVNEYVRVVEAYRQDGKVKKAPSLISDVRTSSPFCCPSCNASSRVNRLESWRELVKDFLGHKAGERIAVGDSDHSDLIKSGVAQPFSDDPITPLIARGLESAMSGFTRGLASTIAIATRATA